MLLLNSLCSFVEGEYRVSVLCLVSGLEVSIVGFLLLFDVIGLCSLELALESWNMNMEFIIIFFIEEFEKY